MQILRAHWKDWRIKLRLATAERVQLPVSLHCNLFLLASQLAEQEAAALAASNLSESAQDQDADSVVDTDIHETSSVSGYSSQVENVIAEESSDIEEYSD